MTILAIRTDNPLAELTLLDNNKKLAQERWQAQGILADTIHPRMNKMLKALGISIDNIGGVVCFQGPGSFTGLRIGISVGNALAYAQKIPIVATKGDDWLQKGIEKLLSGQNQKITTPFYGSNPHVTQPKN